MKPHEFISQRTGASLETLLAAVVRVIDEAVIAIDESQEIIFFNQSAERLFGYPAPEVLGRSVDLLIPPRWREAHRDQIERFAQAPETTRLMGARQEISCMRCDGSEFPAHASITKARLENATIFTAVLRDITVQKRTVDQLQTVTNAMAVYLAREDWQQASGMLLRGALDQTQSEYGFIGAVTTDSVLRIFAHEGIVWDQSENTALYENALRMYREVGYLEFRNFNNLFGHAITTGQAILSNKPASDPRAGGRPSGHPPLRCFLGVPMSSGTEVVGMIGLANRPAGYTRQDQAAIEILVQFGGVLYDSYRRRQRESLLREQLLQSQKMEAVGRLAGGIAHDFNNLLTTILGNVDLLLQTLPADDGRRNDIEEIREAGQSAVSLTRQLLAFSRKQILELVVLDLNAVVRNLNQMLRRLIGEDVEVMMRLDPGLGPVKADPGQIEQVLLNLAVNARDAMPEGGTLTIETTNVELDEQYARTHADTAPGRYVMFGVSDTGHGMDEQTQAHLFEPFFTTKEKGKGTGLGLATVYGIVKQSGGNIWVHSEPGHGTTFKVYLPRVEGATAPLAEAKPTVELPIATETVLIVEDNTGVRALARKILERSGYTVLDAANGAEALAICERHAGAIHLLLTDVVMPGMDGRALAARVARLRPEIMVLYTSGYTDNGIAQHGILDAGTAFLQKPYGLDVLTQKVREVLDAVK